MNKKDLFFITIAVAVLGIFIFLSVIGRKPPQMTERAEHGGVTRNTSRDTCIGCHGPGSIAPIQWQGSEKNHPKKGVPPDTMNCFACHRPPAGPVAASVANETKRK